MSSLKSPSLLVPGRGGGGGKYRRVLAIFGLLVSLASSGLKEGRSLTKVGGQHRRFQVSFVPIGAPDMLAAKFKERERKTKREGRNRERERKCEKEKREKQRETEKREKDRKTEKTHGERKNERERKKDR